MIISGQPLAFAGSRKIPQFDQLLAKQKEVLACEQHALEMEQMTMPLNYAEYCRVLHKTLQVNFSLHLVHHSVEIPIGNIFNSNM